MRALLSNIDGGCLNRVAGNATREVQCATSFSLFQLLHNVGVNAELIPEPEFDPTIEL